ncbi:MAG: restriction endonuclease [Candidatus Aenigmarchaeota archaeon]|nr:restriction endonuclease [Candidatus Aenigmarchaeota archaeon]
MQVFSINSVDDLDKLSHKVKWQFFEKLVAFVFEQNGFAVRQNVVLQLGGTKRQFDVLAERFGILFAIECKKQKKLAVSSAIDKHLERCEMLAENFGKEAMPLIVTLHDEMTGSGIPIVPLLKLNAFINEIL